jgi:hypothetical protein
MTAPLYDPWGEDYRPGFSDDMKQIHGLGPVYFFATDKGESRLIQRGFVREIDPPYRRGRGVQWRFFGRVVGLGLCRRKKFANDYEATKAALEAHDVDADAPKIGDWDGTSQEEG